MASITGFVTKHPVWSVAIALLALLIVAAVVVITQSIMVFEPGPSGPAPSR